MNFEWCLVYVRSHANTVHLKVKTDYTALFAIILNL